MAFLVMPALPASHPTNTTRTTSATTTTSVAAAPPPPPPAAVKPLPRLLIYEHCPFCVRVRHALGHKRVEHTLVWLNYTDVITPTHLVGTKIAPIFQADGAGTPAMRESADIIALVDGDARYGPTGAVRPPSGRTDLRAWLAAVADPMRRLRRPRFARIPVPELVFRADRALFEERYPLVDPPGYDVNFDRSPEWLATVQELLPALEPLIWSDQSCSEGGFSMDDVELFAELRPMTVVRGLVLPPRVRAYVDFQAAAADIPLFDSCAM